jgi:hypothetical protein
LRSRRRASDLLLIGTTLAPRRHPRARGVQPDTRPTNDLATPRTPQPIDAEKANIAPQAATRLLSSAIQILRL